LGHLKKERKTLRVPVRLAGRVMARADWAVGIVDLSLGGCLVQAPGSLDEGSIIDVHVEIPGQKLSLRGRVIHSSLDGTDLGRRHYLVGLEFLGLPARDEQGLRSFLEGEGRRRRADA
jgi:c-di-GMP-binding flagellar brake protein YcgR